MKVIDLLNKIANGEIENGTIFYVNGDFFYNLVVIDENLYVINTMSKQLELLENKYINRFIRDNTELIILQETTTEDNKIEKLETNVDEDGILYIDGFKFEYEYIMQIVNKINEIIDKIEE